MCVYTCVPIACVCVARSVALWCTRIKPTRSKNTLRAGWNSIMAVHCMKTTSQRNPSCFSTSICKNYTSHQWLLSRFPELTRRQTTFNVLILASTTPFDTKIRYNKLFKNRIPSIMKVPQKACNYVLHILCCTVVIYLSSHRIYITVEEDTCRVVLSTCGRLHLMPCWHYPSLL